MPYVLDGEHARPIVIEAQGIRHQIHVRADQILRQPAIHYQAVELTVKNGGTAVVLEREQACLEEEDENPAFLPRLVSDFSLFNPHASFRFSAGTDQMVFPARDPAWVKWSPRDPTSAHWYTPARLEELVASYVAAGRNLFVREFVAQFRGLTGTQTRMQVLEAAGFARGNGSSKKSWRIASAAPSTSWPSGACSQACGRCRSRPIRRDWACLAKNTSRPASPAATRASATPS